LVGGRKQQYRLCPTLEKPGGLDLIGCDSSVSRNTDSKLTEPQTQTYLKNLRVEILFANHAAAVNSLAAVESRN